ncbi:hypothetical protein TNCV_2165711 [Trichonephila clavipes]|nr:hypothetical protein TNCV_2165711 [Trichonephila clavipes]
MEYATPTKVTPHAEPLRFGRSRDYYSTIDPGTSVAVDFEACTEDQNIRDEILSLQSESVRGLMAKALKRGNFFIEKNGGRLFNVLSVVGNHGGYTYC